MQMESLNMKLIFKLLFIQTPVPRWGGTMEKEEINFADL